jgi:predicted ABC-type ATPase
MERPPQIIVIAGPNGAGKSTAAPALLRGTLKITEFVNADVIAQGLSGFSPETTALAAGQIMLERLHSLADAQRSFAFETTMASRTFAPWIRDLQSTGYQFRLLYLWLPSSGMAIHRVQQRVRSGGHDVDRETIIRRYQAGLNNFFRLYRSIADTWRMYDSSMAKSPQLIATGKRLKTARVHNSEIWNSLLKEHDDA